MKTRDRLLKLVLEAARPLTESEHLALLDGANLFESGVLDSLSAIAFLDALQSEFGIKFDGVAISASTLGDLRVLESLIEGNNA